MAAPPENMSGKGLMFANSRITSPLLDKAAFLKWYDEDHIPEILATGGMPTAIRFIDDGARPNLKDYGNDSSSSSTAARPYLHVYPVQDVAFFRTPQFANIGVTSDLLPGSKLVYDLADFDVRFYNLVQVYDPTRKGPGHTKSMLFAHLALKEGYPEEDLERWYREEHLADLAKAEGYLRTTRYKLIWGRNSDTSRALKTGSSEDKTEAQPAATPARLPEWFALHEFETDKVDIAELQRQLTDWTKKIFANCDEFEIGQMRLDKAFGEKGIFDGEDV